MSIADHDAWLMERWNERVAENDFVFYLGDFAMSKPTLSIPYLEALNGRKILIVGNHDHNKINIPEWKELWYKIYLGYFETWVRWKGHDRLLCLCHYPLQSWNGMRKGALCLHGHVHQNSVAYPMKGLINVGVDQHPELAPFSLEEIMSK